MELKDWLTLAASIVVGLGASGMTLYVTSRQAAKTAQAEQDRALRNYERALTEIVVDLQHLEDANLSGGMRITEMPKQYRAVWEEAYHHVARFPPEDRAVLQWPFGPETEIYDAIPRLDQGISALRAHLKEE
jgi:hypothetical protein